MSNHDLLAIGVNPAMDAYFQGCNVQVNAVNRVDHLLTAPGGKAINFARAYQRLGGNPLVTGIVGGACGADIVGEMQRSGLPEEFVCSNVESRRTFTVVSEMGSTLFLERGGNVEREAFDDLLKQVQSLALRFHTIVVAGSLPPTAPPEYLAELVRSIRAVSQARLVVDAAGSALKLAAEQGVDLIKVNLQEFSAAFAIERTSLNEMQSVFADLRSKGLSTLCITLGSLGALVFDEFDAFGVKTPVDHVVSTAGTGDAFLAGLLLALRDGASMREAARTASATGAIATQRIGAGFIDADQVRRFLAVTTFEPAEALSLEAQS